MDHSFYVVTAEMSLIYCQMQGVFNLYLGPVRVCCDTHQLCREGFLRISGTAFPSAGSCCQVIDHITEGT